ncbi:MAG TPA: polymer-forming cytoskeletal protein [Thermoanaerobaculia bacterium]|jgi:hypothetical protein|nr:polymer-forming cytoskeletal protein [Thermoanaerobaculia bacterium]
MWTPSDRSARAGRAAARACRRWLPLLAFVVVAVVPGAGALAGSARAASLSAAASRELRQQIEQLYRVSSVHNGVLLRPRGEREGINEVEVSGDSILVNGARVPTATVREWLRDAGAAQLLRLLELPPAERQALFDLPRDAAPASPAAGAPGAGGASPATAAGGAGVAGEADQGAGRGLPSIPSIPSIPSVPTVPPVAIEPPEPPEPPEMPATPALPMVVNSGSRVMFGHPVTVRKNEVAESVVTIGGAVHIDGGVSRDVAAVGGSVRVNGHVGGSVKAFGGNVHLGPHAEVMGDVAALGGTVVRDPGALVHGSISDVGNMAPWGHTDDDWDDSWLTLAPLGHSLHLFWSLAGLLLLLLAVTLVVLLAPGALEQVRVRVADEPWTAAAAGFLGQILVGPALVALVVVLIISIIGCLLLALVPFLILALLIAGLVGFAGVSYQAGRLLEERFNVHFGGAYLATMVGVLVIEAPTFLGHLLAVGGGLFHIPATMFVIFGLLLRYLAWTVGFGAAILTAFANRPQRLRRRGQPGPVAPSGAPPPSPTPPTPPTPPARPLAGTFEPPAASGAAPAPPAAAGDVGPPPPAVP